MSVRRRTLSEQRSYVLGRALAKAIRSIEGSTTTDTQRKDILCEARKYLNGIPSILELDKLDCLRMLDAIAEYWGIEL